MKMKDEIEGVARHLRLVCSQQIEDLEDQLPRKIILAGDSDE